MLDLKKIRTNPEEIEKKLRTKDPTIQLSPIIELDNKIREILTEVENLKSTRNKLSKEIGEKKGSEKESSKLMEEVKKIGDKIAKLDHQLKELEEERNYKLSILPNLPMDDIPVALEAKDNVCIKMHKKKPTFDFPFKNHLELNEKLKLFDFVSAAKISGSGWPLYQGIGARLEWALINFMIDTHIKNGFKFILPPLLAKPDILYGSGQLPKFKDQLFKLTDEEYNLYMIPTSEVVLNGINFDTILDETQLPIKYVSYTPCFRREAGSAGKNERGLIRTHQFNKVELFCFTTPEDSPKIFEEMIKSAEEVLQGLDLHYRNMLLVTGDMSFASAKTIDIEVWLPGQDRYYEVSSVSNCTDYQARRSLIRCKKGAEKPRLVHTLNGSGVATSRLMVALLENNQNKDGSVNIPKVLHKYLEDEIAVLKPQ
jgi:seryl-tRNA synthetase